MSFAGGLTALSVRWRHWLVPLPAAIAVVLLGVALLAPQASAQDEDAPISVTSTCDLVDAVSSVNIGELLADCTGDPADGIIELPGGTYPLTEPIPDIEQDVTFVGNGTIIDATSVSGDVFTVAGTAHVVFEGFTISGSPSVAITAGVCTCRIDLRNMTLTLNVGGVNVGGLANLTVTETIFLLNQIGVTFTGAQAITIINSTFAANTQEGLNTFGAVSLVQSTVANNGIGWRNNGPSPVTYRSTIFAGNGTNCVGDFADGGASLSSDSSCTDLNADQSVQNLLGELSYAGCSNPCTKVHPLTTGHPGIDTGICDYLIDQQGLTRPQGSAGNCNAGSTEAEVPADSSDRAVIEAVIDPPINENLTVTLTPTIAACGEAITLNFTGAGGTQEAELADDCSYAVLSHDHPDKYFLDLELVPEVTAGGQVQMNFKGISPTTSRVEVNHDHEGDFDQVADVTIQRKDGDCPNEEQVVQTNEQLVVEVALQQTTATLGEPCTYGVSVQLDGYGVLPAEVVGSPGDTFTFEATEQGGFYVEFHFPPGFGGIDPTLFERLIQVYAVDEGCTPDQRLRVPAWEPFHVDVNPGCAVVVTPEVVDGLIDDFGSQTWTGPEDGDLDWNQGPNLSGEQRPFFASDGSVVIELGAGWFREPPTGFMESEVASFPLLFRQEFKLLPDPGDDDTSGHVTGVANALASESRLEYLIPADVPPGTYRVTISGTLLNGQAFSASSTLVYPPPSAGGPVVALPLPVIDNAPPATQGAWEAPVVTGAAAVATPSAVNQAPAAQTAPVTQAPLAVTGTDSTSLLAVSLSLAAAGMGCLGLERTYRRLRRRQ